MFTLILLYTFGFITKRRLHPSVRRYCYLHSRPSSLRLVFITGLSFICYVLKTWGRYLERLRRIEGFIFSTLERDYPANLVGFVDVLPANLHGFVGAISEHLMHDVLFSPVNFGELQSFLKAPWPGDYNITLFSNQMLIVLFGSWTMQKPQ